MSCVLTWSSASRRVAMAMVCLALVAPAAALAQQPASQRPFRGLFGGNAGASDRPQSLDLNASVYAGYDDDIFARGAGPRPEDQRLAGNFVGAQAGLSYSKVYATSSLSANASTSVRWLADRGEFVPTMYGGSISYQRQLAPRTTLGLSQGVAYSPRLTLAPFPAASTLGPSLSENSEPPDFADEGLVGAGLPGDFAIVAARDALVYNGRAVIARALSQRSTVSLSGAYSVADIRNDEFEGFSNHRLRAAGRYSYAVTPNLRSRIGYGYRTFRTRTGATTEGHDIDVGLDYGRPFTIGGNRTRLSFSTGTSVVARDRLSQEDGGRLVLRAVGAATLDHAFSATWQSQVRYSRTVGFLDGLADAYSGDQVTGSLSGLIGRRTDILASVGYLSGAIGLRDRNFNTALGTVRARFALTQTVALFAQYFYYQYDYTQPIADQLGLAPTLERQGVRGGLTVWLPLVR